MFHQLKKKCAVRRNLADDNAHLDVTVSRKRLTILYRISDGEVFEEMY